MSSKPKNLTREKPFQIYVLKAPKPYRSSHKGETLTIDELETANKYKKELPIKIYELKAPKSENKGNITQTYKTFKSKSLQPPKPYKGRTLKMCELEPPKFYNRSTLKIYDIRAPKSYNRETLKIFELRHPRSN